MSAEVLRRAAALMRERAKAAHAGPWEDRTHRDYPWVALYSDEASIPVEDSLPSMEPGGTASPADAAHIASWHPAVALAVADWLDAEADEQEVLGSPDEPNVTPAGTLAYSVASAYLGETA